MTNKIRVMLYVDDIQKMTDFWSDLFKVTPLVSEELPEHYTTSVIALSDSIELALFEKEFINKYSPEVACNTPSLIIFSDQFDLIYRRLEQPGDIINPTGTDMFNFSDPEGNYFVIARNE